MLRDIAECLRSMRPRTFILENVSGVIKKRSSQDSRSVADWVKEILKEKVPDYQIHDFMLGSHPVLGPYLLSVLQNSIRAAFSSVVLLLLLAQRCC